MRLLLTIVSAFSILTTAVGMAASEKIGSIAIGAEKIVHPVQNKDDAVRITYLFGKAIVKRGESFVRCKDITLSVVPERFAPSLLDTLVFGHGGCELNLNQKLTLVPQISIRITKNSWRILGGT